MWRVILVDDEEFVRAELAMLFPWERYQFDLIGEAENAEAAISLIEAAQPDLVITDIRMPEMDGLALISWIGAHHPHITTAVVSAYNDFPSVREALRLGAVDYLMKAEATLETAGVFLERMGGILEQRHAARRKQEELSSSAARYHQVAAEFFWRDALTRASSEPVLQNRARQLGIQVEGVWFGIIIIHLSNDRSRREEHETYRMRLENLLREVWTCQWGWTLIDFKQGDFVIIASLAGSNQTIPDPGSESSEKLQEIAQRLASNSVEKRTTSASSHVSSFKDLPENFQEVREINLLRLYHQAGNYLTAADFLRLQPLEPLKISELLAVWERTLRGVESEAIHGFLNSVFENILPHSFRPEEARRLVLDFVNTMRRISLEHQIQWENASPQKPDLPGILDQAESIDDWRSQLDLLIARYLQIIKVNTSPQASVGIQKALVYLQTNFKRDLSLDEVAEHAGVSKSYLSRVFPEYTGEHFSDYLQRLRIERAKELLRFSNEPIYQIALQVGFWNRRYFSKVFHEAVGMTPADYRRAPYELSNE
ncbi:MAG TPA: helix-turn-helix domain-containing protein [Bacillota bacterium]|nr:helix-turn-helix domain-containing protein [Bacillota bacterium]